MHVSLLNLVFLLQVLQVAKKKKKKVMRCLNLDCKPSWSDSASEICSGARSFYTNRKGMKRAAARHYSTKVYSFYLKLKARELIIYCVVMSVPYQFYFQ